MSTVLCQFDKCGLHFVNKFDLVHHIEEDHIPVIEEKRLQDLDAIKRLCGKTANNLSEADLMKNGQPLSQQEQLQIFFGQPVPMSLLCKMRPFAKGYKVHPVMPMRVTMKFCHYRRRIPLPQSSENFVSVDGGATVNSASTVMDSIYGEPTGNLHSSGSSTMKRTASNALKRGAMMDVLASSEMKPAGGGKLLQQQSVLVIGTNTSSLVGVNNNKGSSQLGSLNMSAPNAGTLHVTDERRFRCDIDGCKKAYKNQQGLRTHIRNAHSAVNAAVASTIGQRLSPSEESILSRQLPGSAGMNMTVAAHPPHGSHHSPSPLVMGASTGGGGATIGPVGGVVGSGPTGNIYCDGNIIMAERAESESVHGTTVLVPASSSLSADSSAALKSGGEAVSCVGGMAPTQQLHLLSQQPTTVLMRDAVGMGHGGTASSNYVIVSSSCGGSSSLTGGAGIALTVPPCGGGTAASMPTVRQIVKQSAITGMPITAVGGGGPSTSPLVMSQRSRISHRGFTAVQSSKIQCQFCSKTYKTTLNLNKHIQESHSKQMGGTPSYVSVSPTPQHFISASGITSSSPGRSQSPRISLNTPSKQQQPQQAHSSTQNLRVPSVSGSTTAFQQQSLATTNTATTNQQYTAGQSLAVNQLQQSQQQQSLSSGASTTVTLVAAPTPSASSTSMPLSSSASTTTYIQRGSMAPAQQQQQYYVTTNPPSSSSSGNGGANTIHFQNSSSQIQSRQYVQQPEHQYIQSQTQYASSPSPSLGGGIYQSQQQHTTTIYVSQQSSSQQTSQSQQQQHQSSSTAQLQQYSVTSQSAQSQAAIVSGSASGGNQQQLKWLSWSAEDGGTTPKHQRLDGGGVSPITQQPSSIIVGRAVASTMSQQQQRSNVGQHAVTYNQHHGSRVQSQSTMSGVQVARSAGGSNVQQQYYSGGGHHQPQQLRQMSQNSASGVPSTSTTTIRVSSLNQLQQPSQQQQQFVQIQQQPSYATAGSGGSNVGSSSAGSSGQLQTVVVRTTHASQQQRHFTQQYVEQHQAVSGSGILAPNRSLTASPNFVGVAQSQSTGGSSSGYYRGSASGQMLVRSADMYQSGGTASASQTTRMLSTGSGGVHHGYNQQQHSIQSATMLYAQQQPPSGVGPSSGYLSSASIQNQQHHVGGYGQQLQQHQQQSRGRQGRFANANYIMSSSAAASSSQHHHPQTQPTGQHQYGATNEIFVQQGFDPSTPIRTIVSRGLEQGRHGYINIGRSGGSHTTTAYVSNSDMKQQNAPPHLPASESGGAEPPRLHPQQELSVCGGGSSLTTAESQQQLSDSWRLVPGDKKLPATQLKPAVTSS